MKTENIIATQICECDDHKPFIAIQMVTQSTLITVIISKN